MCRSRSGVAFVIALLAMLTHSAVAWGVDCNTNGRDDSLDIGPVADCNTNGIPDECDIANGIAADCQLNGVIDACDAGVACGNGGVTLIPPQPLNSNAGSDTGNDFNIQLVGDGRGVWLAVWSVVGTAGADRDLLFARSLDNGATWSAAQHLNSNAATDTGADTDPSVATDGSGRWVAVWTSTDSLGGTIGNDNDVLVSISIDHAATWSPPAPLNANAATDAGIDGVPRIATDRHGRWVCVWASNGSYGADFDVLFARSDDGGEHWTVPVPVNSNAATDSGFDGGPQVSTDTVGTWIITWNTNDPLGGANPGGDYDIAIARSHDNANAFGPLTIINSNAAGDSNVDDVPQIANDQRGAWLITWRGRGMLGADYDVFVSRSTDLGASWSAMTPVNTDAAGDSRQDLQPQIATDRAGNWCVAWYTQGGAPYGNDGDVFVSRSTDRGASWSALQPLNTNAASDTGADFFPDIAADSRGQWVGGWLSYENLNGQTGTEGDMLFTRFSLGPCYAPYTDCNLNGVADECDVGSGFYLDCNLNRVLDVCETLPDCNSNGFADQCELYTRPELDCDIDGVLDPCEFLPDCDSNGIADACDISSGFAADCDANGIPDACLPPADSDGDGYSNCIDGCPLDVNKQYPGLCGCHVPDTDGDGDGTPDCVDGCPNDSAKTSPGICGCNVPDVDSDGDGIPDCLDGCPLDYFKTSPGACGCGHMDVDADTDGVLDCMDGCPNDATKTSPGACGCHVADSDADSDGVPDCVDSCYGPNTDGDGDGVPDCNDYCPSDPQKTQPGTCGCGTSDADADSDGAPDCIDGCPSDAAKTSPGYCGCNVPDLDSDGDGAPDCADGCPNDARSMGECVGRCCIGAESCEISTLGDCSARMGVYGGDGSDCAGNPCNIICPCPGDADADGRVDLADLSSFIYCLLAQQGCVYCAHDLNNDGYFDGCDIQPFVDALARGVPCGAPPQGACIIFDFCFITTEDYCDSIEGAYQGDDSECPCGNGDVDLGIDSNNNDLVFIDRAADDPIEENAPGKYICVNNDDDNANGMADKDEAGEVVGENDLAPIIMSHQCDETGRQWKLTYSNKLKVYETSRRTGYMASGVAHNFPLPGVCYVEGVNNSAASGAEEIVLAIIRTAGGAVLASDRVVATVIRIDLHADSLNASNTPDFGPALTADEDAKEDLASLPGRLICVNDDDDDNDGVDDFVDGYDADAIPNNADDLNTAENDFVRTTLELPAPLDPTVARIRFSSTGVFRTWTKNGNANPRRRFVPLTDGGDYISQITVAASALGFTNAQRTINLWQEGIFPDSAVRPSRLMVSVDPDGNGPIGFVCDDAVRFKTCRVDVLRHDDTDAGKFVPLFNPEPLIRIPNVPADFDNGAITEYALANEGCVASDVLSYVTFVTMYTSGAGDAGTTTALFLDDQAAPATPGDPYHTRFRESAGQSLRLRNLDTLRGMPLGTRRRYVFRAGNILVKRSFEELILEVQLNPADGRHRIVPINLGPAPDAVLASIPNTQRVKIRFVPTPPNDNVDRAMLSRPLYNNAHPDGASALKGNEIQDPVECVMIGSGARFLRTTNPQRHFFPHIIPPFPIASVDVTYKVGGMAECKKTVVAVGFDLKVFLTDDDSERAIPVAVRYQGSGVGIDETNFERYKWLTLPFSVRLPLMPDGVTMREGVMRLAWEGSNTAAAVFSRENVTKPWKALAFPWEVSFTTENLLALSNRQYVIAGLRDTETTELRLDYTYKGRRIVEDYVSLKVTALKGLAGDGLAAFPHISDAHTFNTNNTAHIGDTITMALDPFQWQHLCLNYVPLTDPALKPRATWNIVPHKRPQDWADNNALNPAGTREKPLEGKTIADNQTTPTARPAAGDYDVVIDLADANGMNLPNGRLDPGDVIGKLTHNNTGHAAAAEVHVVHDPLADATTNFVHYGYIDYGTVDTTLAANRFTIPDATDGNTGDVTDNYYHGRIYYPTSDTASGHDRRCATGPFPLVVILHGNHYPYRYLERLRMAGTINATRRDAITPRENYLGYEFLQQYLARRGYISMSVDLDRYFAQGVAGFSWPYPGIRARAYCAGMNVNRVRELNMAGSGSRISERINLDDITLIGHSRGGEAVIELSIYRDATTGPFAAPNSIANFNITRVFSIAPTSNHDGSVGQRPYFCLHGAADGDVSNAAGFRLYDRAPQRKSMIFIDGADHNQFNSSWVYSDATHYVYRLRVEPLTAPVTGALTNRTYQENLLKSYVYAFIKDGPYREFLNRPTERLRPPQLGTGTLGDATFPRIHLQYRIADGDCTVLDNYQTHADADRSSSSSAAGNVTQLGLTLSDPDKNLNDTASHYYNLTNGAEIRWDFSNGVDLYTQASDAAVRNVATRDFLSLRVGPHYQQTVRQAVTLELKDNLNAVSYMTSSALAEISVPQAAVRSNLNAMYQVDGTTTDITKMMFKTFRFDLSAMQGDGRALNTRDIRSVRLIFDQDTTVHTGRVALDDLEFND